MISETVNQLYNLTLKHHWVILIKKKKGHLQNIGLQQNVDKNLSETRQMDVLWKEDVEGCSCKQKMAGKKTDNSKCWMEAKSPFMYCVFSSNKKENSVFIICS